MTARRIGLRMISSKKWRGGINYIINLTKALHSLPEGERPEVILLTYDEAGIELASGLTPYVTSIHPLSQAAELNLDVVYPVTQLFEAPLDAPWAAWIPDWQCQYLPDMFDDLELRRRELHFRYLATRAPLLVHSSRMAATDSTRKFGHDLVPTELLTFPSVVEASEIEDGYSRLSNLRTKYDLPERFFLVANQWWRHKNHHVLLEALKKSSRRDMTIVCTGDTVDHRSPDYTKDFFAEIEAAGLSGQMRVLGSMDRGDQVALMLSAVAIIQPSKFEGWSTVVEEARSLGKRILLSDFPVHRDQNPPRASFFDPDDAAELARLMSVILDDIDAQDVIPDNEAYFRLCARQLVHISQAARKGYKPKDHDPIRLISDAFVELVACGVSDLDQTVLERFSAGARGYVKANPAALDRLSRMIEHAHPEVQSVFLTQILEPLGHSFATAMNAEHQPAALTMGRSFYFRMKSVAMRVLKGP